MDISKVCKRYGITSRTLRFYEEKGLIKGQKSPDSGRRQYSEDDLQTLQSILTLRAIGLPVKEIRECLKDGKPLKENLRYREKELEAAIRGKIEEVMLLQKALAAVEEGKDVLDAIRDSDGEESDRKNAAKTCAKYVLQNEYEKLSPLFSPKMKAYFPKEVFEASREELLFGIGAFQNYGKTWADPANDNIIYTVLCFEKMAVQIKFVFHGKLIHGLWFEYAENKKGVKKT